MTTKQALEQLIKDLKEEGIDIGASSDNGFVSFINEEGNVEVLSFANQN